MISGGNSALLEDLRDDQAVIAVKLQNTKSRSDLEGSTSDECES